MVHSPVRVGFRCQARCDHHPWRQVQTMRSQPPAWQWRWKQSPMLSTGLYQEVTARLRMPSSSVTQWACYKKWNVWNAQTGAGIAQWSEHRTRDWKVAGSNPCWNGGRIFFSRVDFLCWLLFRYPFHPRVTTVARKKSRSFCQKCRWQVTAKHAYTLRMWILLNRASALVTTCP